MSYDAMENDVTMAGGVQDSLLMNRYRILKQLGTGGMGSVWLAEDTQLDGKLFAIKMMPSILVSNKRAYRQLKNEALVAMKLTHTHIVTLRAFEENGGNPFLVMDYVEGQTLDKCLEGWGNLSPEETAAFLKPIAEALDYAHSQGIVHRDIKPGNVIVRSDGIPFILDFGIAREMQESMTQITGQRSNGTLFYMSPEQLNGDAPSPAQDVYSFAAMAYECIKGTPPFTRGNVGYQIVNNAPEPLSSAEDGHPSVVAGIMAGLSKIPEERPASCVALLSGEGLVQSPADAESSASAEPPPPVPDGGTDGKRGQFANLAAPLAALLTALAMLGAFLGRQFIGDDKTPADAMPADTPESRPVAARAVPVPKSATGGVQHVRSGKQLQTEKNKEAPWAPGPTDGLLLSDDGKTLLSAPKGLKNVAIPDGVTKIADRAFSGQKELMYVSIPPSVAEIGTDVFNDCGKLSGIYISDLAAWCRLSFRRDERWWLRGDYPLKLARNLYLNGNFVEDMEIPQGVTSIGENAFRGCSSITLVKIPGSVRTIEPGAFADCSRLAEIAVDENNQYYKSVDGLLLTKDGRKLVSVPAGKEDVTIPDGVVRIEKKAFLRCRRIAKLNIPDGVQEIGFRAFDGCSSLTRVTFPPSLQKLDDGVFADCDGLLDIYISDLAAWCALRRDWRLFGQKVNLHLNGTLVTELKIPDGVTQINDFVFRGVSRITDVTIPRSVAQIKDNPFSDCPDLMRFEVASGNRYYQSVNGFLLTKDGKTLVAVPTGLERISIPNGVEIIGKVAAQGCEKIEAMELPHGLKEIHNHAFDHCSNLKRVTMPEGVDSIGSWAFRNCKSLESVTITEGLTNIAENAFEGCDKLLDANGKPRLIRVPRGANADKMPKKTVVDKELDVKLPPYEIIDSRKSLAMGGASGGDEVRMVVNTNGTCDIIHIFNETEVTKTLVVPKNNRIIPNSGKFLVVGGGGTSSTWDGRGGGGAGGVVVRKNVGVAPGTAYVYVGSGGERYGWHGRNGDDSILTLCGTTYIAIGGGAGGGFSGGSGGGGQSITGQIGRGLQAKSASGGLGYDGFGDEGEVRCGGGGPAARSGISGDLVVYAKGGVDEVRSPSEAKGEASTGSGASFGGWDGPSFSKLAGGSGIVVLRYTVKRPVSRLPVANVPPEFPGQDKNLRKKRVAGIEWCYFVEKDGSATIGSHAEGGLEHPDLWQPAVDVNALSGIVKIPNKIDGRPVRKIGKGALQGCTRVTQFVVPDGVTHCGPRAFARCSSLEVVEYPGSIQWLGEGQVYNSRKIKYLRFQSAPPQCDYGRCPFKGTSGEGVCLGVPFALQSGWQNRIRDDKPFHLCGDGCHLCKLMMIPSVEETKEADRTGAGFVSMQLKWKPMEDLITSNRDWESNTNDIRLCQNWLVHRIENAWRDYDRLANHRVLAIVFDNPEKTATIFVGMMHFRAYEPVFFRHSIDDYGTIMVDDNIALDFDMKSSHNRTCEGKNPILFPVDGWHRLALISANATKDGGGWANYKRGEKGKWRNFETNPDGAEFRVTKEDARRAVDAIERANGR